MSTDLHVAERVEAAIVAAAEGEGPAAIAVAAALERVQRRRPCWGPAPVAEAVLAGRPLVGRARAALSGRPGTPGAWWQPAEAGDDVVTVAEAAWLPSGGLAVDEVVACDPRDPARWWRLTGGAWALGAGLLAPPPAKARLMRRPLAWARAGGAAAGLGCVMDWRAPAAAELLLAEADLVASDPAEGGLGALDARIAHGEALARRVRETRPRGARVKVLEDEEPSEREREAA